MRKRIGFRRHSIDIMVHNGTVDSYGQKTYNNPSDWDVFFSGWPCEFISTVGGEILRGRMVTEKSTHAAFGNFAAVEGITTKMRVVHNGHNYGITSVGDPDGTRSEMRVELRKEVELS